MPGVGSNPNWPQLRVYVDFTNPGASATTTWTEITSYCKRIGPGQLAHIERGRNYERAQTDSGTLNFVIDNSTGAFDPANAASPFYPHVKPIRKIQVRATWAATTYNLYTGRVEDWPRIWKASGFWGEITATARGILSSLSSIILDAPWVDASVLKGATAIYRMNDPSGSVSAANSSPFQQFYAPIAYTNSTTPNSSFSFGSNPGIGNLAGDPTNSLTLTPEASTNRAAGYYLQTAASSDGSSGLFLSGLGNWSFEIWFNTSSVNETQDRFIFCQQGTPPTTTQIQLYVQASDSTIAVLLSNSGTGFFVNTTSKIVDDNWHQLLVTVSADGKTLIVYVDGVATSQTVATAGGMSSPPLLQAIGTDLDPVGSPNGAGCFGGAVKNAAWYIGTVLSPTDVADLFSAGQGYPGEDTGARIARILNYAPYALQALDTGNSTLGRANLEGVNVVQAMETCINTEVGTLIERGDGYIVFKNRQSRNPLNASLTTFGETGVPYQLEDFNLQQDPALIYTDVKAARDLGITVIASDTTAETDFFPRTLTVNSISNSDDQVMGLAQFLLGQYKVPRTRVTSLTIVPSANVSLWPTALGREIGDRVTVRRANPGAPTVLEDFYIEKITHDIGVGSWRTTYMMSSSSLWDSTFILDDSTYGVLDTSGLGF